MSVAGRSGAESLCEALAGAGVRCVFGIPGTQNVALFDALRRSHIRTVLTASELGAAFMAGAFARVSGEIGVLVTIAGPGFTYALPGLAEAQADSAAVLHVTGLPAQGPGRRFQFQAIDQSAIAAPLVKAVVSAGAPDGVGAATREAIDLALRGEPGPVLLQVADAALAGNDAKSHSPPAPPIHPSGPMDEAVRAFAAARRPVLLVGQGVSGASDLLRRVAEQRRVPVLTTPSGRGCLPEDHELSFGFDPLRHDLHTVNELLNGSDLILAIGCKLSHNGTAGFALALPPERLVHVDASPDVLGVNYPARVTVCASARAFLAAVAAAALEPSTWAAHDLERAGARLRAVRPADLPEPHVGGESAAAFFAALRHSLPRDAAVVTDSGMHQVLARRYYDVWAPAGLLFPSDFQSMGFGLPAAVGAALAAPDRRVVAVVGDGGFRMTGMEITTAVRERLPLVVFVFTDGHLNQIRLQQLGEFGRAHAVTLGALDLEGFAAATGAAFARLRGDAAAVLDRAAQVQGPTLVEVPVGDSVAVHATRARGLMGATARRALGPRLLSWLKGRRG